MRKAPDLTLTLTPALYMTGVVAAEAADAVTAGTPMMARPASAAPMAMSSFLTVIPPNDRREIRRTFPSASTRTAEETWVRRQMASSMQSIGQPRRTC